MTILVPPVLKSCAEFIETHGIVDGIYRLSGVTSNIQKLRQEFASDQCPDLTKEIYLQDIHCVGSLCKLYFRELPNPLLTYELYKKFTEAVSSYPKEEQLVQIQNAIQELPSSHYRTLEYLIKHLAHLASFSSMTNMHARNLALVWAPNLLRSKEIEAVGCNGDAAFLEVRVQQLVIEFILNHVDEIFNDHVSARPKETEENKPIVKSLTLPSATLPMKLVSLEEAQARSLSACHPARKERRENSLPEIVPATGSFFHTVLDLPDGKRKLSTKSKKWKSIFNLGRSGTESKSKLSRNGSVFVRGQKLSEKATIRPAKSMDSLCSLPVEGDAEKGRFKRTAVAGGFFVPMTKPRTGGPSGCSDLNRLESEWVPQAVMKGAEGGTEDGGDKDASQPTQIRSLPEQLKVFRPIEDPEGEQTSPKIYRMFYTSNDGATKSGFHGTLFPLEASPRHQRKALNISEPFAVSVPLRVSAVISINSTPCRTPAKEKSVLSSLQESSFLGLDNAISSALEGAKPEHTIIKEEKKEKSKPGTDATAEKIATAKKPESLGVLPRAATMLEAKSSVNNSALGEQLSQEQKPQADGDEASQLEMKNSPERGSWQQEGPSSQVEDSSLLSEQVDGGHSNVTMEPLWPEIQQELKIVESEEEASFPLALAPETAHQPQEFKSSPAFLPSGEANNLPCSLVLPPTPSKENTVRTLPAVLHIPLFGASSKTSIESSACGSALLTEQDGVTSTLLELENIPYDLPCSKEYLEMAETRNDLPPQFQDWKLSLDQKENATLSIDKSSHLKEKHADQSKWENNSVFRQRQQEGIVVTQAEKTDKTLSDQRGLACLNSIRVYQLKGSIMNNQGQDFLDQQDDDAWTDHGQSLELVEPWEDHHWVTSPLHSPTFKDTQGEILHEFQTPCQGKGRAHFKKPCFSRSFSLDSKDTVRRHWATQLPFTCTDEDHLHENFLSGIKQPSQALWRGSDRVEAWLNLSEELSKSDDSSRISLSREAGFAARELPSEHEGLYPITPKLLEEKETYENRENEEVLKHESPLLQFNSEKSISSSSPEKGTSRVQESGSPAPAVIKDPCFAKELQSGKNEGISQKEKTRPSSLNLESVLPAANLYNFESLSVPIPSRNVVCAPKEIRGSDSVPSLPVACPNRDKADLWGSRFDHQDLDLDYIMMAHAVTGRRNSAPVSVSAVRTSFMVKMCQAKAVPVIPPKIQYTQVPQPLQTQNPNFRAQENKESETNNGQHKPAQNSEGQLQPPKSPQGDRKGKENNGAALMDSVATGKVEPSLSNHNSTQDIPILRRKRTSEGETTTDNPQCSKMERPSGISKPSYRCRPGRPQSLILFSPPFPIMDHPSSSVDSRVLLSPIRSPSQTTSPELVSDDLSGTTLEGVTLRNKMTIPKNGQRLETSTSCFYQPQRRSVILDGRSGRQIE
uniref:Uncharacterized protein n=1 Tax=Sphaerodactylus townsendi TaxID=933632 RepID=A0ACB8FGV8_9SAUR